MPRNPYSPEVRERAVRMCFDHRPEYPSEWAAMTAHRGQARHDARDAADVGPSGRDRRRQRAGLTTDERERMKELEKENQRAPSSQRDPEGRLDFLRDRARRSNEEVVAYIDARKGRWGVEPICRTLQFAPATYYAAKTRPPCARQVRDEQLKPEISRVFAENFAVYGADKVWAQLNREGNRVARCTVERLMRRPGPPGRPAGPGLEADDHRRRHARPTGRPGRPPVQRVGRQPAVGGRPDLREDPHRLGLRGLRRRRLQPLHRRLAGLDVTAQRPGHRRPGDGHLRPEEDLAGLVHHSDRGVQYLSIRYTERLAEAGP